MTDYTIVDVKKYDRKGNELPINMRRCLGCVNNFKVCDCRVYSGRSENFRFARK